MKNHLRRIVFGIALSYFSNSYASVSNNGFSRDVLQTDDTAYIAAEANASGDKPFSLSLSGDWISKTKTQRNHHHDDYFCSERHFEYWEAFADASMVFYYDKCHKEGLSATIEYSSVDFNLSHNIFFEQKHFQTASLSIGGSTKRFPNWEIKGQAAMNIDAQTWNFNQYLTLDFVLWGRYQLTRSIGVHTGLLVETGMKIDHVYPIVGLDWSVTKNFKLNLVYPVDVSAVYQFAKDWSIAAAGRLFSVRHRASEEDWIPKSLFYFRSAGGELSLTYNNHCWAIASIHAGYTYGGKITLANRHYKHKQHFDVDSSGYAGGELTFSF